jgi:hypothetical protein
MTLQTIVTFWIPVPPLEGYPINMSFIPSIRFGGTYKLDSVQMEHHIRKKNSDLEPTHRRNAQEPVNEIPLDNFTKSDSPELSVEGKEVSLYANGQKEISLDHIASVEQSGTRGINIKMSPEANYENGVYKLKFDSPSKAQEAFEELTEHHSVPPYYRKHTYD